LERGWRQHIERQRSSGWSVRDYCDAHDLTESSFYLWRRTIAKRDRASTPAFVPVVIKDAPRVDGSPIEIRLAGGQRVCVWAGCDRKLLADILAVLEDRPC
jgi:transposase-like protein